MKQIYLFVLLVAMAVALNTSCSEQADFPKLEDTEITAKFDVKLAKEAFVRDYTAAVEARSETTRAQSQIYYTLADTDYTPLWDKAKNTENDHVLSIDVPLYSVSGAFVSDTDGENMRMATQKLIVIQSKKSGDTFSYLLTLCPDVACAEKYADLSNVFTHLGDCSKFSGLAIYTSLAGELVAVDKFVNGVETGYVYVGNPEADQHALHHQAEHLMEYMKFYLSSTPVEMTRGGGEGDTIYEDLCAYCLQTPCKCAYYEICHTCGRYKAPEGIVDYGACQCGNEEVGKEKMCEWCNRPRADCICIEEPDIDFCDDCHQPTNACICDFFDGEGDACNICGQVVCVCPNGGNACPICGDITCNGDCGHNPSDPVICEYCDRKCEGTCEAYCPICHRLKRDCDEHKCVSCNEFYYQCVCK